MTKYNLGHLLRKVAKVLPRNVRADRAAQSVSTSDLGKMVGVEVAPAGITMAEHEHWVNQYYPSWKSRYQVVRHKKLIEFYSSFFLLNPGKEHVFLDVAGGQDSYVGRLRCRRRLLQDIVITDTLRSKIGNGVEYVECDAANMPLPACSIDRMSCHHSFEHFQGTADIGFIREIQRVLAIGGKCCIIPLFVGDKFVDITDTLPFRGKRDLEARFVYDPTATLPGGDPCGNFARIYDAGAFQERIVANIDSSRFEVRVVELRCDGVAVPDMGLSCHKNVAKANYPYRALLIERFA